MSGRDDFFVGYLGRLPKAARVVMLFAGLGLVAGFAGAAFAVAITADDPGDGAIFWGERLEVTGQIFAEPYPHVRTAPSAEHPEGETLLMVRAGKRGVVDLARRLDGQVVDVFGVWTRRGDIRMIQIGRRGGPAIAESETALESLDLTEPEDLGRWRLTGEICDGKCYLGAMRPGVGLAHRACANLCIAGGVPPVLVTTEEVLGTQFLLIADSDGRALPEDWLLDRTAVLITMDGRIERRGSLLVFKIELDTAEPL